jgi:uncharacterized membrane protein
MNQQERIAWFSVVVTVTSVTVFAILAPFIGLTKATAAFSILALLALPTFFAWRNRTGGRVIFDERDLAIQAKATRITFAVFWLYFWGCAMGAYFIFGEQGTVPVQLVMTIAWLAFALLYFVISLAMIIQYRRGRQNAHG